VGKISWSQPLEHEKESSPFRQKPTALLGFLYTVVVSFSFWVLSRVRRPKEHSRNVQNPQSDTRDPLSSGKIFFLFGL
jgi:hypothetical protein